MPLWYRTSWNVDGHIYYSSNSGIGRLNVATGNFQTVLIANATTFTYRVFDNPILNGKVLFYDFLKSTYFLYDVNNKKYTDTIPKLSGRPIVISDSTIAFVDSKIRIYNLHKKVVSDNFISSCHNADSNSFSDNIYLSFDKAHNMLYHLSYNVTSPSARVI